MNEATMNEPGCLPLTESEREVNELRERAMKIAADLAGTPRPARFHRPSEVLGIGPAASAHDTARAGVAASLALLELGPGRYPLWQVRAHLASAVEALAGLE